MGTNVKLEAYLSKLDRALAALPVSDRAEILIEIKSHVLSAMDRDPAQSPEALLSALGEPEVVANKYLMERGQAPIKPPISPIVKWLVMGFLGTLALLLFFVVSLAWKFSPLLQVDERNERVRILGGLIDVDGKTGLTKIGPGKFSGSFELNTEWADSETIRFSGRKPLDAKVRRAELRFVNGNFDLETSENEDVSWDCRANGNGEREPKFERGTLVFDFSGMKGVRCDLRVPKRAELSLHGTNGKVSADEPRFHLELELVNGKLEITPAADQKYATDLRVVNGKMDQFDNSDAQDAFRLKARLTNGTITREE